MALILTMEPARDPQPRIAETPLDQLTLGIREIPDWRAEPFKVRTETLTGDDAAAEWKYWHHVWQGSAIDA